MELARQRLATPLFRRNQRPGSGRLGSVLAVAVIAPLCVTAPARATEGNQIAYPLGVNTVLGGIHPPPGETRYYNYLQYYTAGETDNFQGRSVVRDFDLRAVVNAARLLHSYKLGSNQQVWFTSGVVLPLVDLKVTAGGRHKETTGIGDLILQQYVNWRDAHRKLFLSAGAALWIPTGSYSSQRLANIGLNHNTFATEMDATWLISPQWDVSATTVFELSSVNEATGYRSGTDSTTDFGVMYTLPKVKWAHVGLNGYFYHQIDDDRRNGAIVPNTSLAQVAALGPQARFELGRSGVAFKWQHEFAAQNRPQGERIWFQFTIPLSGQRAPAPSTAPAVEK